jgi:hypothetical protein
VRRLGKALLALAALALLAQGLRLVFATEEQRIRWRIESMLEGFNSARLAPTLRGIGATWQDERRRVQRAQLADALRYLFFNSKDPQTRAFPYRVELDRGTLHIAVDREDRSLAEVSFEALFSALQDGEWTTTWRLRVEGELQKHENLGWQFQQSSHVTLESDGRLMR